MKTHTKKLKKVAKRANRPIMKRARKQAKGVRGVKRKVFVKESAGGAANSTAQRSTRSKREAVAVRFTPEEIRSGIDTLSNNDAAIGYLKKNVSKRATDVINALATPKTDEALALELDMKINAVRRILNILQGYGVTNYYIAKNVNGWLSFAWYINIGKLPPFFEYIKTLESKAQTVSENCNDYFVCENCYDKSKLIFTFDAAFEEEFKCSVCSNKLQMVDRTQASSLMDKAQEESKMAADAHAEG